MSLQQNRKVSFSDINKSLSVTNGNTGIGTTAPSHTLDVNGGLRSTNFTTTNALITNVTTTTLSVSSLISVSDTANAPASAVTGTNVRFSNGGVSYLNQNPPDEYNPNGSTDTRPYYYSSSYFVTALTVDPNPDPGYSPYSYFYNPTAFKYIGSSSAVVNWRVQTPGANAPMFGTYTIYVDILDTDGTTIISTPATLVYSSGSLVTDTGIETTTLNPNQYIRFRAVDGAMGMMSSINEFIFTYDLSVNVSGLIANSSGITTGTLKSTSIISTTGTVGTLINTNTVSTNISSATLNLSSGVTAASANITTSLMAIGNSNTIGNIYTTGGNVGIGAISPTAKLNVSGSTDLFGNLRVGYSSSSTGFNIDLGTSGAVDSYRSGYLYGDGTTIYLTNQQNGALNFGTNNTWNRLVITAAGNVGIGTSSPSFPLDVNGTIRSRSSVNGANSIIIDNPNTGSSAYSALTLVTDGIGNFNIFKNSTTRTSDGGVNTVTIRNDGGAVRLMSNTGSGMVIDTSGNVTVYGALSKGSGTFDIQHPLHPNDKTKHLVHSFIEGPRCDLIYRGEVQLVNGTATINIDSDCVAEPGCEMTQGTFEALCANPHFFLQNPSSFSRLKGNIQGNILTIECEDQDSSDIVYWNIIAERKDNTVKEWNRTNENGYLITEYEKEDLHN